MMDVATRRLVRQRAGQRCEFCRLPQSTAPFLTFHIEHIRAQQHVQDNSPENLALACPHCNFHKGPTLAGIDPESGEVTTLFHHRLQIWTDHFELVGEQVRGRTPTGRATVSLLNMNTDEQVQIRGELIERGEF